MKPWPILLFAVLLGAARADPLPAIPFEKTTLPNGLELILVEDHRLPLVAVNLWYHVGPANEKPGLTGFAHLFEHMMFAGSRHLPRGAADKFLEGAGATDSNGSTDYDRTNYYDTVPSNQLALALWVHADRMGYLLDVLDQKALDNQQDVVRNERRESVENRPYGIVEEALNHHLFPRTHPYYASVIGSHADIQSAKLADVRDFFKRYYGPNNASLVIAGDIDKERTRALVMRYFGSFKAGAPVPKPVVVTPPITAERRQVVRDRVEVPRIFMGWLTPPAFQAGDAELAIAAQILAGGKSSRLYKKLVYERQIAQETNAAQNSHALTSFFTIDVTARAGIDAAELESAIDAELDALRTSGPTAREVERARNTIETAMLSAIEKLGGNGLANQLNEYNQYTGDPGYLHRDMARLRRVTPADVQRVVRAQLQPRARAVVTGVPGTPPPEPKVAVAKAARQAGDGGTNADETWRATAPPPGPMPTVSLPQAQAFSLPNGLRVIHYDNPALPLVSAELVMRSGSDANPGPRPGLAGFTAQMLDQGTATRSATQIADEVAQLGAFLGSASTPDASSVGLLSLSSNFTQALGVMADVVQHPAFPVAEVERQRAARIGDLSRQRDEAGAVAAVAGAAALYGPRHPYGYGQLGTEPALRDTTRNDIAGFWSRHYVPGNAALVVVGDIRLADLEKLAAAQFGAWPQAEQLPVMPGAPVSTPARVVLVDKPGAGQTALRITSLGAARSTPDYAALQVMNGALGGLFTSRINNKVREEKGYSYGMFSQFRYDRTPGPFIIAGSVRSDATGPAVAAILAEVRAMQDAPLSKAELENARNAQVLSLPAQFDTNQAIGASLADSFIFDLPLDYYQSLPAAFARVDAAQVQAVARHYLAPEQMIVVAVGARAVVAPQLAKLKLGTVEIRDTEGQLHRP
jgi:zinc protease